MNLRDLRVQYRSEILAIAERNGAESVWVFGSLAREEAREDSDVDFLVHMKPGTSLLDMGGLYDELEQLLGKVDVVSDEGISTHRRERILAEALPL